MSPKIKNIKLLNLSAEPKIEIRDWPLSKNNNSDIKPGQLVLVRTQKAQELNFYIVLEVIEHKNDKYIGKVLGEESYKGPLEAIYPGKYIKFEFDGLSYDDLIYFEQKHIH